jgi:hypothetical protein
MREEIVGETGKKVEQNVIFNQQQTTTVVTTKPNHLI